MLTRFLDMNDTLSLMGAFEKQMNEAFHDTWTRPARKATARDSELSLRDDGDKLTLTASLPGVSQSDLEITMEGDILTLKAERKLDVPKDFRLVRRERGSHVFSRQIELNVPVVGDQIEAALEDGILTVTLPKAPEAKPRKILIGQRDQSRLSS